jgi:hypothetical protein
MAIHLLFTITITVACFYIGAHMTRGIDVDQIRPPISAAVGSVWSLYTGLGGWAGWDIATIVAGPI